MINDAQEKFLAIEYYAKLWKPRGGRASLARGSRLERARADRLFGKAQQDMRFVLGAVRSIQVSAARVHLARRRARHDLRRAHRFGHILQGNEAGDQPPLCVPPRSGIDLLLGGSLQSDHAVADPGLGVGARAIFYHFARRPAASGPGLLFKLLRYGYSHTAQSGMELQYHAPQPTSRTCT